MSEVIPSRYEILTKLASGGMGTVYVGRARGAGGFSRVVAIKRAHPNLVANHDARRRMLTEAKIASGIHHANVVSVLDVEEREDDVLLIMEYVEGTSLSTIVEVAETENAPLDYGIAIRILLDAANGVHATHSATDEDGKPLGLIHRDISPHNILVGADGVSKLTDFGIAKTLLSVDRSTTKVGALKGKLAYMAPEYIENGTESVESDVFSLGLTAIEAITSQRLRFSGFLGRAKRQKEVESILDTLDPSLLPLRQVLTTAVAWDPKERFHSAADFSRALERVAREQGWISGQLEVAQLVLDRHGTRLGQVRSAVRERAVENPLANQTVGIDEGEAPSVSTISEAPHPLRTKVFRRSVWAAIAAGIVVAIFGSYRLLSSSSSAAAPATSSIESTMTAETNMPAAIQMAPVSADSDLYDGIVADGGTRSTSANRPWTPRTHKNRSTAKPAEPATPPPAPNPYKRH